MGDKKRILIIADADSFWTRRLMEHLLLPAGYELVLFPIWGDGGKYADFYRDNGVTVYHDRHTLPVIRQDSAASHVGRASPSTRATSSAWGRLTSCTTTTSPSATWRWGGWWRGASTRTGRAASGAAISCAQARWRFGA